MTYPNPDLIYELLEPLKRMYGVPESSLRERSNQISMALSEDYQRHEKTVCQAILLTAQKERLVYWLGRIIRDQDISPAIQGAQQSLLDFGYCNKKLNQVLELGEPRNHLSPVR